jgi:HlyD family secretion protein
MAVKRTLQDITRKESADAITSPDQLDQLMIVTQTRGWITLMVIGTILLLAIGWSIFGQISRNVNGLGMLLPAEDPILVQAKASGQLVAFGFTEGDEVKKGDVLAKINDTVAQLRLSDLQKQYDALEKIHHDLDNHEDAQIKLSSASLEKQLISINNSITDNQALITLQHEQLDAENELLKSGLIQKQQMIQTKQTLTTLINNQLQAEAQIKIATLTHDSTVTGLAQQKDVRTTQLLIKESAIRELQSQIIQDHLVVSPVNGTIMETRFDLSNMVSAGSNVIELLPKTTRKDTCIAYVDATYGKRIEVGMIALVSPTIARPEKYGYITGKVIAVGELIASRATISLSYSNELFVQQVIQQNPSPIKVVIELDTDTSSTSGYKWTSDKGWPYAIHIGTIANIKVEYETERPIELFLPWLKKVFLGVGKNDSTQ